MINEAVRYDITLSEADARYLKLDASNSPLTGALTMPNIISSVALGTQPYACASATLNTNLNADLIDGQHGAYYLDSANFTGISWTDLTDTGFTTLHKHTHNLMQIAVHTDVEVTYTPAKWDLILRGTSSWFGEPANPLATKKYLQSYGDGANPTWVAYEQVAITDLSAFTSANLRSVISDETGSGLAVFNNSPALITPSLGVASATSLDIDNYITWTGQRITTAQVDKSVTSLTNITGLAVNVTAGNRYYFRAVLFVNPDAVGGHKYSIDGTATATSVIFQIKSVNNSTDANEIMSRQTALGGSAGVVGSTEAYTEILGSIVVSADGTIVPRFAQQVASGTSSVLIGSFFEVHKI